MRSRIRCTIPWPRARRPNGSRRCIALRKFEFILQFAWQPTPRSKRIELKEKKASGEQSPALAEAPAGGP